MFKNKLNITYINHYGEIILRNMKSFVYPCHKKDVYLRIKQNNKTKPKLWILIEF